MMELEITSDSEHGRLIPIKGKSVVFGRSEPADIVFDWDEMISARHFQVLLEGRQYYLVDLHSTNGTYVNGQRIQACRLDDGDQIDAGRTCFTVRIPYTDSMEPVPVSEPVAHLGTDASLNRSIEASTPRTGTIASPCPLHHQASKRTTSSAAPYTQLRLRIVSAHETGKLFWLSAGQSLTFGGNARSDCCLEFDVLLSSEHFRITCDSDGCMAEDLQSTRGTFLNGQAISRADLSHGDRLLAGETEFEIEIEGAADSITQPTPETSAPRTSSPNSAVVPATASLAVIKSTCASGLTRIRGTIPEDALIADIIERLCGLGSFYFMIDFSRLGIELPPEVDVAGSSLFAWLPHEAASQAPQVVSMAEFSDWKILLEEGWGSDAIVGLQSDLDKVALLTELRDLALGSAKPGSSSLGVSGFCWPLVLSAMLENDVQSFTPRFMQVVKSVVTEVAGEAEAWQLFGSEESVEKCRKLGLTF